MKALFLVIAKPIRHTVFRLTFKAEMMVFVP